MESHIAAELARKLKIYSYNNVFTKKTLRSILKCTNFTSREQKLANKMKNQQ